MECTRFDISTLDFVPLGKELFLEKSIRQSLGATSDDAKAPVKDGEVESRRDHDSKKASDVKPENTPPNTVMEQREFLLSTIQEPFFACTLRCRRWMEEPSS